MMQKLKIVNVGGGLFRNTFYEALWQVWSVESDGKWFKGVFMTRKEAIEFIKAEVAA